MPFCPKCGKEVDSEAEYCYYCGQSLPKKQPSQETKPIPTSQPVPAPPSKPMPEELPLPTSNRSRNIAIVIALIVIVVLVSVVAYAFVTGFIGVATTDSIGVGSMMIDHCQLNAQTSNDVTVFVKNIGTKTLTISTAYIDGVQCTISGNLVVAPNQETSVIVNAPSGQSYTSGMGHQVRIIASDGTVVAAAMAFMMS